MISYSSTCDVVEQEAGSTRHQLCGTITSRRGGQRKIVSTVNAVSVFGKITPEEMKEEQQKDLILKLLYKQVTAGEKLKTSAITKVKSKAVRKYLLQFNQLTLKRGVLHHLYINSDVEYHQLILPVKYQAQVLSLLHDGQGHQRLEHTLALCWERFYWNTMFQNVTNYVKIVHNAKLQRAIM